MITITKETLVMPNDIEPYYSQAEQLYQVHGAQSEDPTEPPASAPYLYPDPYPQVSHEPRIQFGDHLLERLK